VNGRPAQFDFDTTVIGAGLAGLEAARLIAQRGHRVLLVDMKVRPEHTIHTTGIFVRRTLAEFALPEDCLGPPVRRVVIHSPAGRALALESAHDEFRVGRMARLYRVLLDDCVAAGVEWSGSTRMASISAIEGGSAIWLERAGRRWRVRSRLIVGADGAVSRVARSLGLDENSEWIVGVEEVYADVPLAGPPSFDCYLDPRLAPGYIGWWIHDGESAHLGVAGYASAFEPAAALRELKCRVSTQYDLSRVFRVERRGGRIPVNGILRRIGCARGLLVGDAAGAVSPLTAGGLDGCLRLTQLAAQVVSASIDTDSPTPFERYSGDIFRHRFATRLVLRRILSRVRRPWIAEGACRALRFEPFRSLARHIFFGHGSFPDVPLPVTAAATLRPASASAGPGKHPFVAP
jgi:flavin-dependent dehydrogenase